MKLIFLQGCRELVMALIFIWCPISSWSYNWTAQYCPFIKESLFRSNCRPVMWDNDQSIKYPRNLTENVWTWLQYAFLWEENPITSLLSLLTANFAFCILSSIWINTVNHICMKWHKKRSWWWWNFVDRFVLLYLVCG